MSDIKQEVVERIRALDHAGAVRLMEDWAGEHGYPRLFTEILDEAFIRIGKEWQVSQTFTVAEVYAATEVADELLTRIGNTNFPFPAGRPLKGPVVLGNIEGDFHALGRKVVGLFLCAAGWVVHDLGNDAPVSRLLDTAQEYGARVIGVSAMMSSTAAHVRHIREELIRRGLGGRIQLAVGGAVFRACPDLAREVGADGSGASALDAPALFDRLWARSLAFDGSRGP